MSEQMPLPLPRKPQDIDHGLVRRQSSLLAAVKLCISLGGFDADKEVYMPLGIDAGHWSRIHRGEANFPIDKLCALMDLCCNEAPLLWLLDARGYDLNSLRVKETETEAELRLAREEISRLRSESRTQIELLTQIVSGRPPVQPLPQRGVHA